MAKDIKRANRAVAKDEPRYIKEMPASRRHDQRQWLLHGTTIFRRGSIQVVKDQKLDIKRKANRWVLLKAVRDLEKEEAAA